MNKILWLFSGNLASTYLFFSLSNLRVFFFILRTPRDVNGAPVLNLRAYNAVVSHGTPLFPAGITEPTFVKVPKEPVGKIGVNERALDILGNKGVNKSVSQPEDLFLKTQNELARKTARLQEEEALKECKRKAHEKRQINILSREVERLRGEAIEKEKEILTLRQKYPS